MERLPVGINRSGTSTETKPRRRWWSTGTGSGTRGSGQVKTQLLHKQIKLEPHGSETLLVPWIRTTDLGVKAECKACVTAFPRRSSDGKVFGVNAERKIGCYSCKPQCRRTRLRSNHAGLSKTMKATMWTVQAARVNAIGYQVFLNGFDTLFNNHAITCTWRCSPRRSGVRIPRQTRDGSHLVGTLFCCFAHITAC